MIFMMILDLEREMKRVDADIKKAAKTVLYSI